jgi:hypothetical protein
MQHKLSQKPKECEGMNGWRMVCVRGGSMECQARGQVRQKKFSHARERRGRNETEKKGQRKAGDLLFLALEG